MGIKNVIELDKREDRVLNIVKAKFGLKNKSEAVTLVVKAYEESLEPELRPEFVERLKKIDSEKGIPFRNIGELREIIRG
ncbi:DUF2683 family protein [Candidatus Pacearchaeota archaeon]|nr:DUF2683 family protein [Candidatus Pacearchaeota archaeon]